MTKENLLNALNWRYATKKFDTSQKVDEDTLQILLKSANLTATSLGLQGYKILLIKDDTWKKELKSATFNQENIQTCSHLLVLCLRKDVDKTYIQQHVRYMEKVRDLEEGKLQKYEDMCHGFVDSMDEERKTHWLAHQVYIVLGNLMTSCALLQIDACPMEGFNAKLVDEILDLEAQNLQSVVMLPLGFRAEDDSFALAKKVRRPLNEMVFEP